MSQLGDAVNKLSIDAIAGKHGTNPETARAIITDYLKANLEALNDAPVQSLSELSIKPNPEPPASDDAFRPRIMRSGMPQEEFYNQVQKTNSYEGRLLVIKCKELDVVQEGADLSAIGQAAHEVGAALYNFLKDETQFTKFKVASEWAEVLNSLLPESLKIRVVRPGELTDNLRMSFRPGIVEVENVSGWVITRDAITLFKADVSGTLR